VAALEDVLDLYAEPYDSRRPTVCFDETPQQLVADKLPPLPTQPGEVARVDYEYQRNGTCNAFVFFEPQAGWRHVALTDRRTKLDFAHQMKWLVDECHPTAVMIRVVLDNLNTHRVASLYEAFPPAEARRIAKRLEFHHTPKHGSWLNMAELEISIFDRQCGTVAWATVPRWSTRPKRLRLSETRPRRQFIGASPLKMPARLCNDCIRPFLCVELLVTLSFDLTMALR
jgi:hypothetical protein